MILLPVLGALLILIGGLLAAVIIWQALRLLPPEVMPRRPSFFDVLWRVSVAAVGTLVLFSVYFRLFPE